MNTESDVPNDNSSIERNSNIFAKDMLKGFFNLFCFFFLLIFFFDSVFLYSYSYIFVELLFFSLQQVMWFFKNSNPWRQITAEEVWKHNELNSIWIVGNNSVYDVTNLVAIHPGGSVAMVQCGGGRKDCTVDFFFHSSGARSLWNQYKIGEISNTEKEKLTKHLREGGKNRKGVREELKEVKLKKDPNRALGSSTSAAEEHSLGSTFLNSPDWIVYSSCERSHHPFESI